MNKVKKILTTLVAATLTVSTGLTSMPMFAHNVKAESKAETISSDTNDMSQYKKINGISSQTVLGADFSHYQLQKNAWKKVWKNYKGIEVSNVFEYVRSQGINTISVKVAVNPTKDKEGNESYLSLENAKKTLKEAKKAGLKTNVTLLYSDDITYAGVQKLPDGWDTDSAEKKALEYTKNVIKELKAADAVPTMITIGREHGTMGDKVAEKIRRQFELPLYDKAHLLRIVEETDDYDELNAFFNDRKVNSLLYAIAMSENVSSNDVPFGIIKKIIGNTGGVVMDSCGNYLFRDRPNTVRIFMHADKNIRIENLMKYLGISKEQAEKEIETEDSKRYEFHKYYTNEIWGMSNGYELCLDEGILGIDGCVKMILDYLKIRNLI